MPTDDIRRKLKGQARRAAERRREVQADAEEERQALQGLRIWAIVAAITLLALVGLAVYGASIVGG